MAYKVNYLKAMKKGWICSHCKRKNDKEDQKCAFCWEEKSALKNNNKFNATRTQYGNRWYHSKKEAEYAERLDLQKMAGEIKDWEPQVKIKLTVNGQFVTNYFIDFKVITKDGGIEYHEVKGAETMLWRLKWAILHANKENIIEKDAELVIIK